MNAAIEYILRYDRNEKLLSLPCSLFLENVNKRKEKLIISLLRKYGGDSIIVRQYNVQNRNFETDFKEFVISYKDIFHHPTVIVEGFKLLEFREQTFNCEEKQIAEFPHGLVQDRQYKDRLINFFSPKIMNKIRENWLWNCFNSVVTKMENGQYNVWSCEHQKEYIRHYRRDFSKIWDLWKKNFLFKSDPAAELIFAKYYKSQFLKYIPEQPKAKKINPLYQLVMGN